MCELTLPCSMYYVFSNKTGSTKIELTRAFPNSVGLLFLPIFYYIDVLLQDTSLLYFQELQDAAQLWHCERRDKAQL